MKLFIWNVDTDFTVIVVAETVEQARQLAEEKIQPHNKHVIEFEPEVNELPHADIIWHVRDCG